MERLRKDLAYLRRDFGSHPKRRISRIHEAEQRLSRRFAAILPSFSIRAAQKRRTMRGSMIPTPQPEPSAPYCDNVPSVNVSQVVSGRGEEEEPKTLLRAVSQKRVERRLGHVQRSIWSVYRTRLPSVCPAYVHGAGKRFLADNEDAK